MSDSGRRQERKAFLVTWSEGDPTLVLADGFADAVKTFCNNEADDECTAEEVEGWIDSVSCVASRIVSARANY